MATVSAAITNSQTITITVTSLATNTFATSNAIDNSANLFLAANVQVTLKTAAASTNAYGYANIYLIRSADGGTTYDDNNKVCIGSMPLIANATTYIASFSTALVGDLGTHWKIAVENQSGATLDASVGGAAFAGVKFTVA